MKTVGRRLRGIPSLPPVLQRAPRDPENLRQLDVVFSDRTGLNDGSRHALEHDTFRSGEIAPALNPLREVGDVTIEPFAGNVWGESVHARRMKSTSAQVGNEWEISHLRKNRHDPQGLRVDASPCLVKWAVCRSTQKPKTPRWRLEEEKKVGNEKSDLSWNLTGGTRTQGQTASHKEIS